MDKTSEKNKGAEMKDEREEIKNAIEVIKRNAKDEFSAEVILKTFDLSSLDELKKRIRIIEDSNYNPDLTRELLPIDFQFFFNLCAVYLKSIMQQLPGVQK